MKEDIDLAKIVQNFCWKHLRDKEKQQTLEACEASIDSQIFTYPTKFQLGQALSHYDGVCVHFGEEVQYWEEEGVVLSYILKLFVHWENKN